MGSARSYNIVTLILVLLTSILSINNYHNARKLAQQYEIDYAHHTHRILYIDRHFTDDDQEIITSAALEWSRKTHNIITIDIVYLPLKKGESIDASNGIVLNEVSPDHPDVILLDSKFEMPTLGYFRRNNYIPHIGIVSDRIKTDNMLYAVMLHELGHALGLDHDESAWGKGTLMYPNLDDGSFEITNKDLDKFCQIYKCNPEKLYDQ